MATAKSTNGQPSTGVRGHRGASFPRTSRCTIQVPRARTTTKSATNRFDPAPTGIDRLSSGSESGSPKAMSRRAGFREAASAANAPGGAGGGPAGGGGGGLPPRGGGAGGGWAQPPPATSKSAAGRDASG